MIKRGFTIIELMIVISIIGILGGVLLPNYAAYIIKAKETKAEQIGRMIFVSSMRSYMLSDSFVKEDVNTDINEDVNIQNLQIVVNDASQDGKTISEDFHTEGLQYEIVVHGDSDTYVLTKE